ncbi:MAG TPA: phosphohydrolase, partial [Opitutaceae bacterium]|nr:phosphohydrolase [Opitutaceae bacterium]
MSVRNQLKLIVGGLSGRRGSRPPHPHALPSAMGEFLERSRVVAGLIFIFTVASIALISSVGVSTLDAPLVVGQTASSRVTALVSFNYESAEKTRAAREQFLDRVPPVYRLDTKPLQLFDAAAHMLLNQLAAFEAANPGNASPLLSRRAELARLADTFNSHSPAYN